MAVNEMRLLSRLVASRGGSLWSPLPVLWERVRVRVIGDAESCRRSKSPSPQPSPGVPGEGARALAHPEGGA